MARAASSSDLKAAFEKHKDETEGHVERLQQVFELMGKRAQGKTCGRGILLWLLGVPIPIIILLMLFMR